MPGRPPRVTKTEAIVLRHRRFVEGGRIVTLLTPARGKLDAVARGVLRPRSKLAGHLEPLRCVEVVLAHGRNLDIVTQAQTVESFAALHDDLGRLSTAMYLADLTDRLTVEHHPSGGGWTVDLRPASRLTGAARAGRRHAPRQSLVRDGAARHHRLPPANGMRAHRAVPRWRRTASPGAPLVAVSCARPAAPRIRTRQRSLPPC